MKKVALLSLLSVSIIIAAVLVFQPQTAAGSKKSESAGPGTPLPDSIHKMVQRACMDCHADDGNFMAKGKINFSSWDKYDSEKQFSKAQAMCKVLTKGSMPQKKWCANNPNDVPTQAEKEMVCRWAKSLQK
ncbi:MAG: heme-binding domain-containing protein [bacterium]